MSKIRIKNFGPIKEGFSDDDGNEWMDIKKVTVFIGDQGTGKSSVAKLFSSFIWFEKALNRGDYNNKNLPDIVELLTYQGVQNYLLDRTEIDYVGECYTIKFSKKNGTAINRKTTDEYVVPKIMYVPAERNFLSTIASAYDVKGLPGPLTTFAQELKRANIELDGIKIDLPIRDYAYRYDYNRDVSQILGPGYSINLLEASSGLQSLVPLYVVSRNLTRSITDSDDDFNSNISVNQRIRKEQELNKVTLDNSLSEEEKEKQIDRIKARFHNKCFINIVEEPEQNLFPISQRNILNSLLEFNNNNGNELIITTHSPYIINYISLSIKAHLVSQKIEQYGKKEELNKKLNKIVPGKSIIDPEDLIIYELDDDGKIIKLGDYKGLPSDKNYLNKQLAETNYLFDDLSEIAKLCR